MWKTGREYDPQSKRYIEAPALVKMAAKAVEKDRPWVRLKGEKQDAEASIPSLVTEEDRTIWYYTQKEARDTADVTKKDYAMAMQWLDQQASQTPRAVLDLGCGDALMARRFVRSGRFERVFGLDCSRRQLEQGRKSAETERMVPEDGLFLARADAEALPFREGQIDAVWWGLGAHVVQDVGAALKSIFSVLRPGGGRLLATTPVSQFDAKSLEKMAQEAGFAKVAVKVPRSGTFALFGEKL